MKSMIAMNRTWLRAERAIALFKRLDTAALLVGRLTVGVLFVSTGWGKVHNLEKVASFFGELGIPMPALNATLRATRSSCAAVSSSWVSPAASRRCRSLSRWRSPW
jgi:uncharacterized membrane protein YphA (DoxX/SURF4 family)